MNELRYENWTQERAARLDATAGQKNSLSILLRLAREDAAVLQADLRDVSAARAAALRSARLSESAAGENPARLGAVRRLLDSLERSENDIRARLMKAQSETHRLARLMACFAAREDVAEAGGSVRCA